MTGQLPGDAITAAVEALWNDPRVADCPMTGWTRTIATVALTAALPALTRAITAQAATTERERIRRELQERKAVYVGTNRYIVAVLAKDIEDVLAGAADGAHTPGGAT